MYKKFFKMTLKTSFEYRLNTFFNILSLIVISIGEVLGIYMLFQKFDSVGSWGLYEILFMFGTVCFCYSMAECFGRGFDHFPESIKSGTLDRILIRPIGIKFQVLCSDIDITRLGRSLMGLIVMIIALPNMHIQWTFLKVVVFVGMLLCGFLVFFGTLVIGAGISIYSVENLEFINIMTNGSKEIAFYPLNIYSKWLTKIFTYILPVSCFNYLPVTYLIYGNAVGPIYSIAPFLGCLFIIPCFMFFDYSISKYQGTGS